MQTNADTFCKIQILSTNQYKYFFAICRNTFRKLIQIHLLFIKLYHALISSLRKDSLNFTFSIDLARDALLLLRISREKLLYLFLLVSTGGLENRGESAGIGVFGLGEIGGEDDMPDNEEDGHGEDENGDGENDEEVGDNGTEEHVVDIESFLCLA